MYSLVWDLEVLMGANISIGASIALPAWNPSSGSTLNPVCTYLRLSQDPNGLLEWIYLLSYSAGA